VTQANDTPTEISTAAAMTPEQVTGLDLGEKLRVAREQRSLSLEQVSESLHLDEAVIDALEKGHFEKLGAAVYVRGHLRAYAQLLGLSPDMIVSEYQGGDSESVAEPVLQQPDNLSLNVNPALWGGGALLVLLGVLLGVYVFLGADDLDDSVAVEDSADALVAEEPVHVASSAGDAVSGNPVPAVSRVVAEPKDIAKPETLVVPPEHPVANRPAATMRLGLQFNQESWVEISDANRRLLFGLQHKGNRREVTGEPPFSLLIGNARGVNLTLNDEPFDVPASQVRGKVARFEITSAEFE